jgi:hypothetical protein
MSGQERRKVVVPAAIVAILAIATLAVVGLVRREREGRAAEDQMLIQSGYAEPESLPPNYYSRLVGGAPLPLLVIEGGWSSATVSPVPSTPEKQRRYIARHARLLDEASAIGWFQITFTDLDLASNPPGIQPFAYRGLVTTTLDPKPALAAWDAEFARPLR